MTCAVRDPNLPKGHGVRVNGVTIPRDVIAREVQLYPSRSPTEAWMAAARSLAIRELLLQEARRLEIAAEPLAEPDGKRETGEEAMIRALIEREIVLPQPDAATCRRYYEQNRRRFRSPDIYEAAHILFAARPSDRAAYENARTDAVTVLGMLRQQPELFAELAQSRSACSSAAQGGNLGQITTGQTTPEFERALVAMSPGSLCAEPVATRYGFHVIRLDRKIEGQELPFEHVADRIADYLADSVHRQATAQYIARLVSNARIEGIKLAGADALRVH